MGYPRTSITSDLFLKSLMKNKEEYQTLKKQGVI